MDNTTGTAVWLFSELALSLKAQKGPGFSWEKNQQTYRLFLPDGKEFTCVYNVQATLTENVKEYKALFPDAKEVLRLENLPVYTEGEQQGLADISAIKVTYIPQPSSRMRQRQNRFM